MMRVAFGEEVSAEHRSTPVAPGAPHSHRVILVVEDELLLAQLAAEVLEAEGHRVLTAADSHAALQILRSEPVDLLFTDIDLARGTRGLTLAREARALRPDLAVAYASGGRAGLASDQMVPTSVFLAKSYRLADLAGLPSRRLAC
jgi:CheY-like chemotaxis protein